MISFFFEFTEPYLRATIWSPLVNIPCSCVHENLYFSTCWVLCFCMSITWKISDDVYLFHIIADFRSTFYISYWEKNFEIFNYNYRFICFSFSLLLVFDSHILKLYLGPIKTFNILIFFWSIDTLISIFVNNQQTLRNNILPAIWVCLNKVKLT
jgi:hypothetical protein